MMYVLQHLEKKLEVLHKKTIWQEKKSKDLNGHAAPIYKDRHSEDNKMLNHDENVSSSIRSFAINRCNKNWEDKNLLCPSFTLFLLDQFTISCQHCLSISDARWEKCARIYSGICFSIGAFQSGPYMRGLSAFTPTN